MCARNVGRAYNTNHIYKWNLHLICSFFHKLSFCLVTGSIQFEVIPILEPGPKVACWIVPDPTWPPYGPSNRAIHRLHFPIVQVAHRVQHNHLGNHHPRNNKPCGGGQQNHVHSRGEGWGAGAKASTAGTHQTPPQEYEHKVGYTYRGQWPIIAFITYTSISKQHVYIFEITLWHVSSICPISQVIRNGLNITYSNLNSCVFLSGFANLHVILSLISNS